MILIIYLLDRHRVRTDITCSSRCDCRDAQFAPICSQDGVVFPSSCMGACRRARHDGFNNMVCMICFNLYIERLSGLVEKVVFLWVWYLTTQKWVMCCWSYM